MIHTSNATSAVHQPHGAAVLGKRALERLQRDHSSWTQPLDPLHCARHHPHCSKLVKLYRTHALEGLQDQTYLRHIRDDKLLSSLPPLSLENGRWTSLDWAWPTQSSAGRCADCGHRHSAAPRRLQCMREPCIGPRLPRPTQERSAGHFDVFPADHMSLCNMYCIATVLPLVFANIRQTQCNRSFLGL